MRENDTIYKLDYVPKAGLLEFKKLLESNAYIDIKDWMEGALFAIRGRLEDSGTPLDEIRFLQGKAETLRHVLMFPEEVVRQEIEQVVNKEKEKDDDS